MSESDEVAEAVRAGAITAIERRRAIYTERAKDGTVVDENGVTIRTSAAAHAQAIADNLLNIAAEVREMPL